MSIKPVQFGCKKCGGVLTVDFEMDSSSAKVKTKDNARSYDNNGSLELRCKKCDKAVCKVVVQPT